MCVGYDVKINIERIDEHVRKGKNRKKGRTINEHLIVHVCLKRVCPKKKQEAHCSTHTLSQNYTTFNTKMQKFIYKKIYSNKLFKFFLYNFH